MEVDAIEDGKLVKVDEEYAKREGLMIIRRKIEALPEVEPVSLSRLKRAERRAKPLIEEFRRPLDYRQNNVLLELKENFQWEITKKRREKNITRRTLAALTGVSEDDIINLEHGILPKDNFVLVHKVEAILGVKLKKDPSDLVQQSVQTVSPERRVSSSQSTNMEVPKPSNSFSDQEIELE